jgi:hypothetical protein
MWGVGTSKQTGSSSLSILSRLSSMLVGEDRKADYVGDYYGMAGYL